MTPVLGAERTDEVIGWVNALEKLDDVRAAATPGRLIARLTLKEGDILFEFMMVEPKEGDLICDPASGSTSMKSMRSLPSPRAPFGFEDATSHFCVCLKYLRSGGAWPFLEGIRRPSLLRK
jgi:hypothetical protein